jgi:hypothetical protein
VPLVGLTKGVEMYVEGCLSPEYVGRQDGAQRTGLAVMARRSPG